MSAANTITVTGNLAAEPEHRRTAAEIPYARLRVAVNRRTFAADKGEWQDRQDGFFTVVVWREQATNTVRSLRKGDRVVVVGRLISRSYEVTSADDGSPEQRWVTEIEAEEIGASLRWGAWAKEEPRTLTPVEPAGGTGRGTADDDAAEADDDEGPVTVAA